MITQSRPPGLFNLPTSFTAPAGALVLLLSLVLAFSKTAGAQEETQERHGEVVDLLKREAARMTEEALAEIETLEDWQEIRPRVRKQALYMLGLDPFPERTSLNVEITGTLEREHFDIEKIVYESRPGLYVTSNFYLPHSPEGAQPTILYVCGHSPHPAGAKWSYQDHAAWFAENGYNCLILDTHEFAEIAGIHHGLHNLNMWDWLSRGYTPAGVEVWNAVRAVDYLLTRPEVDGERIGITGRSGGGAVSWFAAMVDERIAVSVPVCGTYTFGSQAEDWLAGGQCDCIYYHNTFRLDLPTAGALIAPRPLLMISGREDRLFPPDGYHGVYNKLKKLYALYPGGVERIAEVDEDVPHRSTPFMRQQARSWMNRWLKGDDSPVPRVPNPEEKADSPGDLACLSTLPSNAANFRIQREFVPTATLEEPESLDAWRERRDDVLQELNSKTFNWFPSDKPPFATRIVSENGGWLNRYVDHKIVEFETEPGVSITLRLFKVKDRSRPRPLLLYVKRPGDTLAYMDVDELLPLFGRYDVAVLKPRLADEPVTAEDFTDIERTAVWVGRTIAAMQVWDVWRALQWLRQDEQLDSASVSVYGKGEMGIVTVYAALLDDGVDRIVLRDPPASHRSGPALLNVLRFTDIPEVAGMLAPREIRFIDRIPHGYQLTEAAFELHGAAGGLKSSASLPEALEVSRY